MEVLFIMEKIDSKILSISFDVDSEAEARSLVSKIMECPEAIDNAKGAILLDASKPNPNNGGIVSIDVYNPYAVQPVGKCACNECLDDSEIYPVLKDKMSGFIDNEFDQGLLNAIRYNNKYISDVVSDDIDKGNTKRAISNLLEYIGQVTMFTNINNRNNVLNYVDDILNG